MNRKTLALVHTSSSLEPVFEQLCKEKKLDVDLVHIADSTLIRDVIADGELTADTLERVLHHLTAAEDTIADYIMVTCSSIGPAVDAAQSRLHKPILRVDQPLAEEAVKLGAKIGVVATLVTTLTPTADLIRRQAEKVGKEISIETELCSGAFDAFLIGDLEKHDLAVKDAIERLAPKVDVIVLAQASMARVASQLEAGAVSIPILSSPSLAVDYLASVL
ncbi:aspartate/glutamate racemase family protein [Bythopirellula goksoeyrii]|uniref:Asp/Glu/Hydantoin racemase n=1 Tax=Bythopirellula goksoeyrii TaxID=1400387 RepID=A0A5B9QDM9_9BACT|nr:aspartate/glutamate racemase family protein [Bythopirellula goksoeyrii]QEG35740.1 Asp/Glu/Hydantoin racemase [Bythopirellula goksoeyrii]